MATASEPDVNSLDVGLKSLTSDNRLFPVAVFGVSVSQTFLCCSHLKLFGPPALVLMNV